MGFAHHGRCAAQRLHDVAHGKIDGPTEHHRLTYPPTPRRRLVHGCVHHTSHVTWQSIEGRHTCGRSAGCYAQAQRAHAAARRPCRGPRPRMGNWWSVGRYSPGVHGGPVRRPRRTPQEAERVAAVGASGEIDRTRWARRARRGARTAPRRVIRRAAATARVAGAWLTQPAASRNKICRRAVVIRPPPLTVRTRPDLRPSDFGACESPRTAIGEVQRHDASARTIPFCCNSRRPAAPWVRRISLWCAPVVPWCHAKRATHRIAQTLVCPQRVPAPPTRWAARVVGIASWTMQLEARKRPQPVHWHALAAVRTTVSPNASLTSQTVSPSTRKAPTLGWTLRRLWAIRGPRQEMTAAQRRAVGGLTDIRTTPQPPRDALA